MLYKNEERTERISNVQINKLLVGLSIVCLFFFLLPIHSKFRLWFGNCFESGVDGKNKTSSMNHIKWTRAWTAQVLDFVFLFKYMYRNIITIRSEENWPAYWFQVVCVLDDPFSDYVVRNIWRIKNGCIPKKKHYFVT